MAGFLAAMMSALSPPGSSWAVPPRMPATPELTASCTYRLDPPRRIDLATGVVAVAAAMVTTSCQGEAQPVRVTACIRADGMGTQCQTKAGWIAAEVQFRPWRAGVTYISTGTGCAFVRNPVSQVCTPMGPFSVGL
ncbi:toluene tolerance protein [Mycobacterium decipiens]|uniref:Toluene tolerance protein n=1 Tax=Mycobacterium decipiens TaxID=1430326 RepID=A0A1X2LVR6_9MYCO|nr:toluene tolerance protein [Mycobacterium decipiens]